MTLVWFGPRWDSPVLDDTLESGTPVGRPCAGCGDLILRGERGFSEHTGMQGNDPGTGRVTHLHAECQLDEVAGHLIGLCVCRAIRKTRERAKSVWVHFYDEQGRARWPQTTTR